MQIKEVITAKDERIFLSVPIKLYKDHPYWIRPLDKDIRSVFDPNKNTLAHKGDFTKWILWKNSDPIGRITAFINKKTVLKNNDYPVGGAGFFECIDDQEAANLLFDTAKDWLQKKGMEAMEAPINLGDRGKFWGLLTEGFDHDPNYQINYNYSYYEDLFINYGFREFFKQFSFKRPVKDEFSKTYLEKGNAILNNPDYKFTTLKKKNLDQYIEDFRVIYNIAWARHEGISKLNFKQAKLLIYQIKHVLEEKIVFFAYYKNEPIAFFIMIPEVNQIFKHVNGKLNWWGKLIFLKHKIIKTNKKLLGVIFGVVPELDGKGITQAITLYAAQIVPYQTNYKFLELHGIGDFNPAMLKFIDKLGLCTKIKEHTTYRYLFDQNKPYKRMPIKKKLY